jgi:hypothetical protein
MRFRLIERYLIEDIAAVKKQYSHIPEEDFNRIIRLDPTFDENRDSVGKYGKWLLSLYKKDNPLTSSVDIKKMLSLYDATVKDRTKKIEKDTGKFRSLFDMETAIENASEAELSDRQKLRQRQANKDYDIVYQNDNWAVFVPNTWEADVNLGKGTQWCTADSREDYGKKYYDNYLTHGGEYYVIINKQDKADKYQFHFETEQFMDRFDEEVDIYEFCEENGLSEFFKQEGYNIDDYERTTEKTANEIYQQIHLEYALDVRMLRSLGRLYQDDIYDLLLLYDFINSDRDIEQVCEDQEMYLEQFRDCAYVANIKVADNVNEEYIYSALVETINNYVVGEFYLSGLVGDSPIRHTPVTVYDDDIFITIKSDIVKEYITDWVERGYNSFNEVGHASKDLLETYSGSDLELPYDIIIILGAYLDRFSPSEIYSTIDINNILNILIRDCLIKYREKFCDYYLLEMIRNGEVAEDAPEEDAEGLVDKMFQKVVKL